MFDVRRSARGQRGVALIITLIMLAVITFLATTFLVLSRREAESVNTNTDQTTARFAADTGLERAKVELLSAILATKNDQNLNLMVPTNFFNPFGFQTTISNPTNVSYWYKNGNPLAYNDLIINLTNLIYNPRPPVFVTNRVAGGWDFRFFLDLNRNGRFEPTGVIPETNSLGQPIVDSGNVTNFVSVNGDPQWIGVLRFPERPHSGDNPFLSRWTYLVVPADKVLDVNYIHNQAVTRNVALGNPDGYARNQGVGPWEINLAAFLADLNTNVWNNPLNNPYDYRRWQGNPNLGLAFEDAAALLRYRYAFNYNTLSPADLVFANNANVWLNDGINMYSDGFPRFMTGTALPVETSGTGDQPTRSWLGSDNTNHYFTTQDLFDRAKVANGISLPTFSFVDRLTNASARLDTYDQYTFYRMISQLGMDSEPERKINVNYLNVDTNGNIIPGLETNMISWGDSRIGSAGGITVNGKEVVPPYAPPGPLLFFKTAASAMFQRMDLHENGDPLGRLITVTNIPIWPTNHYTPAVHRILQLAANIFEATTNTLYPSIYRPVFSARGTNIYITDYEQVNGPDTQVTPAGFLTVPIDINDPAPNQRGLIRTVPTALNVYGVPWIIGARKGLPNFNELAMQSVCQITRKLQVTRPLIRKPQFEGYSAKQMFIVGVSNGLAVEFWNSYKTNYPRQVYLQADGTLTMSLTNDQGYVGPLFKYALGGAGVGSTNIPENQWVGTGIIPGGPGNARIPVPQSFVVPLMTNLVLLQDSYAVGNRVYPVATYNGDAFWNSLAINNLAQPQWEVTITNNIRCMIIDGGPTGRVIDYVQLSHLEAPRNLSDEALKFNNTHNIWVTNMNAQKQLWMDVQTVPEGILHQILVSMGSEQADAKEWRDYSPGGKTNDIGAFFSFITSPIVTSNSMQAPFTPTSKIRQMIKWQANDPLVHYLTEDIVDLNNTSNNVVRPPNARFPLITEALWTLSDRYAPWGGPPKKGPDLNAYNTALKDPLVRSSDEWDFPTNKWPNLGWIGRVHRGTPWQTVYLKAADPVLNFQGDAVKNWMTWASDPAIWPPNSTNWIPDAIMTSPVNDRKFLELFTSGPNENASRGHLSVNQTNLAALSAILSGVIVLTNDPVNLTTNPFVLSPAGVHDLNNPTLMFQIWTNINMTRANTNPLVGPVFAHHEFQNLGDIFASPFLSEGFPLLVVTNVGGGNGLASIGAGGITDEVMERIPQQILGLLTESHAPRFIVYSYGQTLRPAPQSIITAGGLNLCTNYQVTAETATRAVVRVVGSPDPQYTNDLVHPHPDRFGQFYPPKLEVEQYNVLPPD